MSTTSTTLPISLKGLINLDKIEDLLNSMNSRIDQQDVLIKLLLDERKQYLTKQDANSKFDSINVNLNNINDMTTVLKSACMIEAKDNSTTTSIDISLQNEKKIDIIHGILSELATKKDVSNDISKLSSSLKDNYKELKEWATPLEMSLHLSSAQTIFSSQLDNIEKTLTNKINRNEMSQLETLATRLTLYDDFKVHTIDNLNALNNQSHSMDTLLHHTVDRFDKVEANIATLQEEIVTYSPLSATHKLTGDVKSILSSIELCASKAATEELKCDIIASNESIDNLSRRLSSNDEHLVKHDEELQTKATIREVKACVLRSHYDEAITTLGIAIDTKANHCDLSVSDNRIHALESYTESESNRLNVAMRFVDWFISRGENYEHNMKVIDKHLGNLTNASNPNDRTPYLGQVKYTNVMSNVEPFHR